MQNKPWIESILRELDFVEWDRYYSYGPDLAFYGWIDREEDQYKDFVVLVLNSGRKHAVSYHTSSAKYSERISDILDIFHSECQRVEDKISIDNMIEVEENNEYDRAN